jgi:hypothetical protein
MIMKMLIYVYCSIMLFYAINNSYMVDVKATTDFEISNLEILNLIES